MFWVLQKNLYNEDAFAKLLAQLRAHNTPYALVDVIPFSEETVEECNPEGPVYVCGSTSMAKVARNKGWVPGYFEDNLNYELTLAHYGEHMLNADAVVGTMTELAHRWDRFFIRPVLDTKQFAGQVMEWDNFVYWRDQLTKMEKLESSYMSLTASDRVVMAPLKPISAEYRFYVVDGRVVTGSLYRVGPQVICSTVVPEHIEAYAQARVDQWQPSRAFVIDIADTSEGLKVIEINAINSSGFYACDMGKYVAAINAMKF